MIRLETIQGAFLRDHLKASPLSMREFEALTLTAQGLVPKRIAQELAISSSAVRKHLRSACDKLSCATTEQAVARFVLLEVNAVLSWMLNSPS